MMHQDARKLFNFVTTESLESRSIETGKAIETHQADICDNINSTLLLGAFDLVACKGKGKLSAEHPQADALIVDAPIAYYELNQRAKARSSFWWLSQCDLVTVGPEFATNGFGAGFPKVSPMFAPFSRALAFLRSEGVVHRLERRYETTHEDNLCREDYSSVDESQTMPLRLLTGLFAFTGGLTIAALVHGLVERRLRGGHVRAQAERQREIEELEWMEAEEKKYLMAEGRKTEAVSRVLGHGIHTTFNICAGWFGYCTYACTIQPMWFCCGAAVPSQDQRCKFGVLLSDAASRDTLFAFDALYLPG